jgi:hypothetical protein
MLTLGTNSNRITGDLLLLALTVAIRGLVLAPKGSGG